MNPPSASFNSVLGIVGAVALTVLGLTLGMARATANYHAATEKRADERLWARGSMGMDSLELSSAPGVGRGKEIYGMVCVACHGQNGEGNELLRSPAIHQQEDWYLRAQMKKFRYGIRGTHPDDIHGSQMRPMMATLPDMEACDDLASYIVSLEAPVAPAKVEGDVAEGRKIYDTVCAECHGKNAEGDREKDAPALSGQNDWYLAVQLTKFRDGVRGAHPRDVTGFQMAEKAKTLTTEEHINDVTAYVTSLTH